MKERNFHNIRICMFKSYEEASVYAAGLVLCEMNDHEDCVLGFATGETPLGMYKELIRLNRAGELDFSNVTAFNLDEYYPISKDNPHSFAYFMRKNLFDHININANRTFIPNGEAEDAAAECAAYEHKIAGMGWVDLQVLGLGNNGHIGFNEPSDHFEARTHKVRLHQSTIDANARFFDAPDMMPGSALTMGIGTIMNAKKILLIAAGEKKAEILRKTILGKITPKVPASVLQLHKEVVVVADEAAAGSLV